MQLIFCSKATKWKEITSFQNRGRIQELWKLWIH